MGLLRLFLALSVACGHSGLAIFGVRLIDPTKAVMIFFAISGFLITYALQAKYCRGAWRTTFWINRALRIYPAYLVMLAITVAGGATGIVDLSIGYGDYGSPLHNLAIQLHDSSLVTRVILIGSNVSTLGLDMLRALSLDAATGSLTPLPATIDGRAFALMGQAWTLGTEILFYALAPFLVRRIETIAPALLACLALSYVDFHIIVPLLAGTEENQFGYLLFFLAGAAICHAYRGTLHAWPVALFALALLAIAENQTPLYAVFIPCVVAALGLLFQLTRRNRIDNYLGELSYPVYITHFLLVQAILPRGASWPKGIEVAVFYGAVLAASALMVMLIEEPVRRFRQRLVIGRGNEGEKSAQALASD